MKKDELARLLATVGGPYRVYFLDGANYSDLFCLEHGAAGWSVTYGERGVKIWESSFPTEDEACLMLLAEVVRSLKRPGLLAGLGPTTRERLAALLAKKAVPGSAYQLSELDLRHGYCLETSDEMWLVTYYASNGVRTRCERFTGESDACLYLLAALVHHLERPDLLADPSA